MLDSSGRYRMRYEDAFRALGHYIDTNRFKDVVVVEVPEGFLIKGQVVQDTGGGFATVPQTYLFTNEDIDLILEDAAKRRRTSSRS